MIMPQIHIGSCTINSCVCESKSRFKITDQVLNIYSSRCFGLRGPRFRPRQGHRLLWPLASQFPQMNMLICII